MEWMSLQHFHRFVIMNLIKNVEGAKFLKASGENVRKTVGGFQGTENVNNQIEWYIPMEKNLRVIMRLLEAFALLALIAKVIFMLIS
jgi:hypothetical protein